MRYEHEPEVVMVNDKYRVLWDFSMDTDHTIEAKELKYDRRGKKKKSMRA